MRQKVNALSLKKEDGILCAFFGRCGGVSRGIYDSLNVGRASQDDPACVRENRRLIAETLTVTPDRFLTPKQAHGNRVVVGEAPWSEPPQADAIVSRAVGIAIGVVTADCVPILFFDPLARVIGAAHAGWRGTKAGIVAMTIEAMCHLSAEPERIRIRIGPAISQMHYEVGKEFQDMFLRDEPWSRECFRTDEHGSIRFDLVKCIRAQLERKAVHSIHVDTRCTYANEAILFSYRRSMQRQDGDYGRQMSAVVLLA